MSVRLPASITISTGRATYRIGRAGRLRRVAAAPSPYPKAAIWFPGTGTWYMLSHHQLVVGRGRRALWRSHLRVASRWHLGVIAAGSRAVVFQFEHKLYLARFGAAERPIARRELPIGWTADGLYTYAYQGRRLLLRSDNGRLVKVIARLGTDYYVANGSLYFVKSGVLWRAHGARIERLASLKGLGLSTDSWLEPLGRFLELEDNHRLVVLHDDGSMFAWTRLPPGHETDVSLVGSPAVSPRAGVVAFATVTDRSADRTVGTETVYLLRSGAHQATPVHTENGAFGGCARWVSLQWHGRWLLYGASEGSVTVIDSTGGYRAIELTRLVRHLSDFQGGLAAYWTGQPTL
ncbi:MAG: hypothetical protein ACXVUL_11665 [Solirubrobacteraceae bacterium]